MVDDVSFDVHEGEVVGVVGPNGSGKTTMFRAILGLQPFQGTVSMFGHTVKRGILPYIGYIPQNATFDPTFPATVYDFVSMGTVTSNAGRKRNDILDRCSKTENIVDPDMSAYDKVMRSLEIVGMADMCNKRIGELSGGQIQRVFIAQTLVHSPRLLFLDEPVQGLDVKSQENFYAMIDEVNTKYGVTVVIALHDLEKLKKHSHNILCMNCGLAFYGTIESFFADEKNVKSYLGDTMAHIHTN